jgi:hypothetical protein
LHGQSKPSAEGILGSPCFGIQAQTSSRQTPLLPSGAFHQPSDVLSSESKENVEPKRRSRVLSDAYENYDGTWGMFGHSFVRNAEDVEVVSGTE